MLLLSVSVSARAAPPPPPWDCHCGLLPYSGGTRWSPCPLSTRPDGGKGRLDSPPHPHKPRCQEIQFRRGGGGQWGPHEPITERGRISALRWGRGELSTHTPRHTHTHTHSYVFLINDLMALCPLQPLVQKEFGSRLGESRDRVLRATPLSQAPPPVG